MRSNFYSWSNTFAKLGFARKKRNKRSRKNHFTRSLRVESLEERQMLTTITVDTSVDELGGSSDISLRDAIAVANPGDTIDFAASLNNATILLDRVGLGEISFGKSLTIDASALDSLTIDADDPSAGRNRDGIRIFNITDPIAGASAPLVEFVGLTLTGADIAGDGGAILSNALLVVRDSILIENEADMGGGIFVKVAGSGASREVLRIENSIIDDNDANFGGGIAVESGSSSTPTADTIVITNSTVISDNTASSNGGGVYVDLYGAVLTIDDSSTLKLNNATNRGGGVYADLNSSALLTFNEILLNQNDASDGAGLYADINTQSTIHLEQTTFDDNEATTDGGGVYADASSQSTLKIADSLFFQNDADGRGGGAFVQLRSDSTASIDQVTFDENNSLNGDGGGLYADLDGSSTSHSKLRIENKSIFSNNNASGSGGGLYTNLDNESTAEIVDSLFTLNESEGSGFSNGGGAIFGKFSTGADALLDIQNTKITGIIGVDGGGVFVDMPYVGHADANGSEFTMQKTLVDSNRATNRGGGIFTGVGSGGEVLIQDSILTGNDAGLTLSGFNGELSNSGGGLYAYLFSDANAAMLTIAGTEVSNNTAGEHGGGIAVCTKRESSTAAISRLNVYNSTISGNEAGHTTGVNVGGTGGGVHLAVFPLEPEEALDAHFQNTTVTENTADTGGGIYSFNQTNSSYSQANTNTWLTNTIISGNKQHDNDANNFWGSINAADTAFNLFGHDPVIKANTFYDHSTHLEIAFAALVGAGNLNNNGTNDPGLLPLGPYGGPTKTHKPLDNSLAIDNGDPQYTLNPTIYPVVNGITLTEDQRGFDRLKDIASVTRTNRGPIDIGAVEVHSLAPIVTEVVISKSGTTKERSFVDLVKLTNESGEALGNQLKGLLFSEADTVSISFSEEVTNVTSASLSLQSIRRFSDYRIEYLGVTPGTFTHTWKLAGNSQALYRSFGENGGSEDPQADQILLSLKQDVPTESIIIAAADSALLDGEWINPNALVPSGGDTSLISRFPSGNGIAGGEFHFVFTTFISGDFDNDNKVGQNDLDLTLLNWGDPEDFVMANVSGWVTEFVADQAFIIGQGELDAVLVNWGDSFTTSGIVGDMNNDGYITNVDLDMLVAAIPGMTVEEWLPLAIGINFNMGQWCCTNVNPDAPS